MDKEFRNRALFILLLGAGAALAWIGRHVILLGFTGLLLALALTSIVNWVRGWLPLAHKWVFAIVLTALAGLLSLGGWYLFPALSEQFATLSETLPKQIDRVRESIEGSRLMRSVMSAAPEGGELLPSSATIMGGASRVFTSALDVVSGVAMVIFLAIFLAANPSLYREGALRLVPPKKRARASEVIDRIICVLKYWLLGQLIAMAVVGALVGISLAIAGIPLAAAIGVLSALFEFIPFVGPVLSALPAILLASSVGMEKVWIVVGIFVVVQFIEGNLLYPLVQHKTIELPPVVTLLSMVLFATLFGFIGVLVATPFAAMMMVLIQELYIKDVLKDPIDRSDKCL